MKLITLNDHKNNNKLLSFFLYLVIAVIIFTLYYKTLSYDISGLDDDTFINMSFSKTSITDILTKTVFLNNISPFYRPILPTSFMFDNLISNSTPAALHTTNVLLHILSSILVFFFLKRYYFNTILSFLTTILFATHPLNIFAVAWIPGRNDSLLFIFTILSFIFFIEYIKNKHTHLIYLHFFTLLLALFTKEVAILIPLACIGYYLTLKKKIEPFFLKIILIWFSIIILFIIWHQFITSHIMSIGSYFSSLTNSYMTFFDYYSGLYLLKIHFSSFTDSLSFILGIFAFIVSFVFVLFSKLSKNEKIIYFLLPIFTIIISLFASQGIYQGSRLYTSIFCILIIFASLIERLRNKKIIYLILVILCLITSYVTSQKIYVFQNSLSFFGTIDSEKPNHSINLANLYSYNLLQKGHFKEASKKIKEIAEITKYKDRYNLYLLSVIYICEKNYNQAIAILESMYYFDKEDIMIKLFICYNAIGNVEKSLFFYKQAVSIYGNEERVNHLIFEQEENLKNVQI